MFFDLMMEIIVFAMGLDFGSERQLVKRHWSETPKLGASQLAFLMTVIIKLQTPTKGQIVRAWPPKVAVLTFVRIDKDLLRRHLFNLTYQQFH
jgi:hypothetical protein